MQTLVRVAAILAFVSASQAYAEPLTAAYKEEQAAEGKHTFDRYCVECHHATLRGSGHGPPLAGRQFLSHWGDRPAAELVTFIRQNMASNLPSPASTARWSASLADMGFP